MPEFILFYDSNDEDAETMGKRRAGELNATAIPAGSVSDLKTQFQRLKDRGAKVDRMLFYAHGDPGGVKFGLGYLTAKILESDFAGAGFEQLFMPGARVFFPSCDLADVKAGCQWPTDACYKTDNGPVFLLSFAKTLLSRGGRVGASNTAGWGFPLWGSKIYHVNWLSETYYALVRLGGGNVRLASGSETDDPAFGSWKVEIGSKSWTYDFRTDGTLARFEPEDSSFWTWSAPSQAGPRGRWRLERDTLEIVWPDGAAESWERPLFTGFQTGVARLRGAEQSVYAQLIRSGG